MEKKAEIIKESKLIRETSASDYIVQEYLNGRTLTAISKRHRMSMSHVRKVLLDYLPGGSKKRKMILKMEEQAKRCATDFDTLVIRAISDGRTVDTPYEAFLKKYDLAKIDQAKDLGYNAYQELKLSRDTTISRLAGMGFTGQAIGDSIGMTRDRIYAILHANGVRKKPVLTKEEREERNESIKAAKRAGQMVQTIADVNGLSRAQVSAIIHEDVRKAKKEVGTDKIKRAKTKVK